uniref:Tachykinin precursor 3b n=1 Tax=Cyprinus carpio carpio TaxID=630221 RepID=A0A9J8AR06_CYPCA
MSCGWLLVLFSHVLLMLACPRPSRCSLDYPSFTDNSDPQSERYEKRYDDIDYDSFIGLMGRRSAANMNDIFVGLLGRRNTLSAIPAWRGQRRGNIFLKDRRQRFCCGV